MSKFPVRRFLVCFRILLASRFIFSDLDKAELKEVSFAASLRNVHIFPVSIRIPPFHTSFAELTFGFGAKGVERKCINSGGVSYRQMALILLFLSYKHRCSTVSCISRSHHVVIIWIPFDEVLTAFLHKILIER